MERQYCSNRSWTKKRTVAATALCAVILGTSTMGTAFAQAPRATGAASESAVKTDSASEVKNDLQKDLQGAVDKFNASDFAGCLDELKAVCAKRPELAPPRILLARWLAQAGLGDAVRTSLEAATEETPDDPEAYVLLGEILLRQQYPTAAELLLDACETKLDAYTANPERKKTIAASLLRVRIALAENRGRWEETRDLIDEAIAANGPTATLLRQKGVALFQLQKDDEAFKLFQQADKLAANGEKTSDGATDSLEGSLPAEAGMSRLYSLRGDVENAKKYLSDALTKYPDSKEVVVLAIQSYLNDDKLEEADALAEKLLAANPDWESAKKLRATVALYLGDYDEAEKRYQELLLASPSDAQAASGLALALCEQDDETKLKRAIEYASENVKKNSRDSDAWGTLGWVLYRAKQPEAAANALKQAAASGRVSAATSYYLARLALQNGNADQAKQLLKAAIDSPTPFAKRRDCVKLYDELNK